MNMTNQERFEHLHKRHHKQVRLLRILCITLFLFLWEFAANAHLIDPFFFSSPSRVILCMTDLFINQNLSSHIAITLLETIISFSLVLICSMGIAVLLWYSKTLSEVFEPFLVMLNGLPKSAMAPLFIVWLGTGIKTIIIAGISVAIFGAIINLYACFQNTDQEKIKLIQTLGGSKKDSFWKVVLPFNIPIILSTMKINLGLALVGVIIGEFLAAKKGLGYLIIYGSQVFKMSMVITSIVILCFIAMIFYIAIQYLEHYSLKHLKQ